MFPSLKTDTSRRPSCLVSAWRLSPNSSATETLQWKQWRRSKEHARQTTAGMAIFFVVLLSLAGSRSDITEHPPRGIRDPVAGQEYSAEPPISIAIAAARESQSRGPSQARRR